MSKKNALTIRLTESIVFLQGSSSRVIDDPHSTLLRGLLTLELAKPTKISCIEVELQGTSSTLKVEGTLSLEDETQMINDPDCTGLGADQAEVTEEHQLFNASLSLLKQDGPDSRGTSPKEFQAGEGY